MLLGWRNVLITNPRDFPAFVKELKKNPFTFITGVNTLYNALLNTPGFADGLFQRAARGARWRHGRSAERGRALGRK